MLVSTQKRAKKNSTKINLIVSAVFHALILGALLYFAAREGLLGKQIKKIAVEMVKEKQPEKPKAPEKPKPEEPKVELPKMAATPKIEPPKESAPPPAAVATAPPAVAPPTADLPAFEFDGGKTVVSSSDPVKLYKGLLEDSLRLNWDRPKGDDDHDNVAEVEVAVDKQGEISDPVWKRKSGQKKWDQSVQEAIAATPKISRAPPKNFPERIVVRFDVEAMQAVGQ
jgi:hypothetical protein